MNRRGFLKAAASILPAAAIPSGAVAMLPSGAIAGGLGAGGGALAAGCAANGAPVLAGMGIAASMARDAYHAAQTGERARYEWWREYRKHRMAVRKGREERQPAKLLWLRKKLKDLRREISQRGINAICAPSVQEAALPRRLGYKKSQARVSHALRIRGLKMPWEYAT